jgi:hypothetical protein
MSRVARQGSECTYCRYRAVQCLEVERPQNQVVLDAFVHLPVRLRLAPRCGLLLAPAAQKNAASDRGRT